MKTLGHVTIDPAGHVLKTGFLRFESPTGCSGLVRVKDSAVEILAITARQHGRGMFRNFIRQLKAEADQITIYEIWNPFLELVLHRYSFTPCTEVQSIEGHVEILTGMRWHKQQN